MRVQNRKIETILQHSQIEHSKKQSWDPYDLISTHYSDAIDKKESINHKPWHRPQASAFNFDDLLSKNKNLE